jgi:hypothetical protein
MIEFLKHSDETEIITYCLPYIEDCVPETKNEELLWKFIAVRQKTDDIHQKNPVRKKTLLQNKKQLEVYTEHLCSLDPSMDNRCNRVVFSLQYAIALLPYDESAKSLNDALRKLADTEEAFNGITDGNGNKQYHCIGHEIYRIKMNIFKRLKAPKEQTIPCLKQLVQHTISYTEISDDAEYIPELIENYLDYLLKARVESKEDYETLKKVIKIMEKHTPKDNKPQQKLLKRIKKIKRLYDIVYK